MRLTTGRYLKINHKEAENVAIYKVYILAAADPLMQGARASVPMLIILFACNILLPKGRLSFLIEYLSYQNAFQTTLPL